MKEADPSMRSIGKKGDDPQSADAILFPDEAAHSARPDPTRLDGRPTTILLLADQEKLPSWCSGRPDRDRDRLRDAGQIEDVDATPKPDQTLNFAAKPSDDLTDRPTDAKEAEPDVDRLGSLDCQPVIS